MSQKRLQRYTDYLESLGLRVGEITTAGSGHYKITVTHRGNRRFFMAPYSTSDRRSFENWKSDVRKWMKEIDSAAQENNTRAKPQPYGVVGRSPATISGKRGGHAMGARR